MKFPKLIKTFADMEFSAKNGRIYTGDDKKPISIKGINWFGFETSDFALQGLSSVNLEKTLKTVAAAGFNAIRMPFSCELALDLEGKRPTNINYAVNPDLQGLTTGEVIDK
jgi:endoglucanase